MTEQETGIESQENPQADGELQPAPAPAPSPVESESPQDSTVDGGDGEPPLAA